MTYQQRTDETARAARMRAYDRDAATLRDPTLCSMPTATLRLCSRPAVLFYRRDGRTVAQYCAQHDRARTGHAAMLRPRPWEYSYHGRNPQG